MTKPAACACVVLMFLSALAVRAAQDQPQVAAPELPKPQKEHEWLKQLAGEWQYDGECTMAPGQPPIKMTGTETIRSLGGFWVMNENKAQVMGTTMTGIMTLGYDPQKKKYVGTWVDSMGSHLWRYEGEVDASGKLLTLNSEGPAMDQPDKIVKYRESVELKDKDTKVFTSSVEKDGKYVPFMKMTSRRKK